MTDVNVTFPPYLACLTSAFTTVPPVQVAVDGGGDGGTIIGVDWNMHEPDPALCCVRIGPSGHNANPATDLANHHANYAGPVDGAGTARPGYWFDNFSVWGQMRRVNLSDAGVVTAVWGDTCFSDYETESRGQVMVEIPKHYYFVDYYLDGSSYEHLRYYVSDSPGTVVTAAGGTGTLVVHPAFVRDGITKEYIYISAYEGSIASGKLQSMGGVERQHDGTTLTQYQTYAHARNDGAVNQWEVLDFLALCDLQLLYIIEYATPQCQVSSYTGTGNYEGLGMGNTYESPYAPPGPTPESSPGLLSTGTTAPFGNVSYGVPYADYAYIGVTYRGIENLWGNGFTLIDGIIIGGVTGNLNFNVYVADSNFASIPATLGTAPYLDVGINVPSSGGAGVGGFGTTPSIASATACPYSFIPMGVAPAPYDWGNGYCCDGIRTATGNCQFMNSGWIDEGHVPGMFTALMNGAYNWNAADWGDGTGHMGARLMYIG